MQSDSMRRTKARTSMNDIKKSKYSCWSMLEICKKIKNKNCQDYSITDVKFVTVRRQQNRITLYEYVVLMTVNERAIKALERCTQRHKM